MGKITGFMELQRIAEVADPVNARVRHYREFVGFVIGFVGCAWPPIGPAPVSPRPGEDAVG